jgi:tRNA(fMet)-specific endonuclease VapC
VRVIYDTNILLQMLRDARSFAKLQNAFQLFDLEDSISLVTLAEIRSLSIQFQWGTIRRSKMEDSISRLAILDINVPEIIDRYVEIDCYSKGKHMSKSSSFSAIKMGKNDLWIAATASVYECKLLTMDLDFGHLHGEFLDVVYVTPSVFTS